MSVGRFRYKPLMQVFPGRCAIPTQEPPAAAYTGACLRAQPIPPRDVPPRESHQIAPGGPPRKGRKPPDPCLPKRPGKPVPPADAAVRPGRESPFRCKPLPFGRRRHGAVVTDAENRRPDLENASSRRDPAGCCCSCFTFRSNACIFCRCRRGRGRSGPPRKISDFSGTPGDPIDFRQMNCRKSDAATARRRAEARLWAVISALTFRSSACIFCRCRRGRGRSGPLCFS